MEMEIMLPPASSGDPAENGSHLVNADGDSGSFCSGSDGTPERLAKKIGRVTAKSPTPSIIDRRRHRTEELSATAKWRLSGIVSGAPTVAAGTGGSPLRSPFGEQNFSTNLLAYSAIRKSLAFSEGEGGRCAPRRSSGLGATADQALHAARDLQETSRGCGWGGEMEKKEVENDSDDEDDATTLLHGWHSQKAAPLVVRVIDDRENMRARKKGPPSWPPCSYAESCQEDETPRANVRRAVPVVAANSLPERALLRLNRFKKDPGFDRYRL
ncbi:hypothetical protein ALC56_01122 [Trachymyrmex septentrionalis]|uniref:Uncharacterized protein n=1 Tax=Trachymyrmex septentrionalis TaxID=34720 RepID=A0A195FX50_9HYME|nr:hypothetical protein ALC56_01122 [Trachymyrmex septentrionalis]